MTDALDLPEIACYPFSQEAELPAGAPAVLEVVADPEVRGSCLALVARVTVLEGSD